MNHTSRRSFIKSAGLATGALGFNILHAQNKGDKLRLAFIAAGGKAGAQVNTAKTAGDICTCFAEIDKNSWGGVLGTWKDAKGYQDYRQLFDKEKDYDAIVVTTPDHQHYMPTALGLMAGKACYTQKPLVHTVWEARQLLEGTRKYKVATQMGNQGHANNGNRRIYEFVNGGLLGDVTEIHCFSNRPIWPQGGPRPAGEDSVPDNIDWDLWIGPAPMRPFKKDVYHPFKWRGFYDFGGGALADMACHTMDSIFMSMNPGFPTKVEVLEINGHSDDQFPLGSIIKWSYAAGKLPNGKDRPAFDVYWYDGKLKNAEGKDVDAADLAHTRIPKELLAMPDGKPMNLPKSGNVFVGSKASLLVSGDYGDNSRVLPLSKAKEVGNPPQLLERLPLGGNEQDHWNEWRAAALGIKPWDSPGSNFLYAAPFTETILLGNVALRVGKGSALEWDAPNIQFKNNPAANKWVTKDYRKGWDIKIS
jgi:hypothetical protein